MNLEQRSLERIEEKFPDSEKADVIGLLHSYDGPENDRVIWDILELSKGSLEKVKLYLQAAQTDYRDILYWAEYYENDPLMKGRDPQQVVDEILARLKSKR
jgi:hypothetical protein